METRFFRSLALPNGTYKTTAYGRLSDLDQALLRFLPAAKDLMLLDAGASSGATTLDWMSLLETRGYAPHVVLADLFITATLVSIAGGLDLLFLTEGKLAQLCLRSRCFCRPVGNWLTARGTVLRAAFSILELAWKAGLLPVRSAHPIRLVSSRLLNRTTVTCEERDLRRPVAGWRGRFHVVRAANLLNRAYFPESTLATIIRNLLDTLRPGGLLVLCRTHSDGRNHASVVQVLPQGFATVVLRLGDGSEVEELALDVAQERVAATTHDGR